jgi:hypothetical protein
MSLFDYTVIIVAVAIVVLTFVLAIKYLIWPGERQDEHIKRRILDDEEVDRE